MSPAVTPTPRRYESRCEIIPLAPGPAGDTSRILRAWGAQGWRLVAATPVPVRTRSELDIRGPGEELGLMVVLERELSDATTDAGQYRFASQGPPPPGEPLTPPTACG